jgi:threonine dehydrogenase-like Zn-dependent dehydrogenase
VVWGAGPVGKAFARALRAAGVSVLSFVDVDPRKIGQRVHGVPVVGLDRAASLGPAVHLAAVGQKGARERVRAEAARMSLADGRDFFAVA